MTKYIVEHIVGVAGREGIGPTIKTSTIEADYYTTSDDNGSPAAAHFYRTGDEVPADLSVPHADVRSDGQVVVHRCIATVWECVTVAEEGALTNDD